VHGPQLSLDGFNSSAPPPLCSSQTRSHSMSRALSSARAGSSASQPPAKRLRIDARAIHAQPADAALANGELDVAKFIKAREFEITALDDAVKSAKAAQSSLAFQELPMSMRRRTASHKIKRLPRRLQPRALGEVQPQGRCFRSNKLQTVPAKAPPSKKQKVIRRTHLQKPASRTNTGSPKNDEITERPGRSSNTGALQKPLVSGKFKKRQSSKTWLPTHLFHAKRAHMTAPDKPLWGFSIPLTPTDKVFRASHRSTSLRGAVAWDTSFMSTVSLEGREDSIAKLLRSLGVGKGGQDEIWGEPGVRWRRGTRTWHGSLHGRDSYPLHPIGPATVIWSATPPVSIDTEKLPKRTVFIRVHPSGFAQLWKILLQLGRVQKPGVIVCDLRYEIGSLELTGPNSTEALVRVLRPVDASDAQIARLWDLLALLTNPSFLPKNVLLAFDAIDPRLHPSDHQQADPSQMQQFVDVCSRWPLDTPQTASLFDGQSRSRTVPSCKSLKQKSETDKNSTEVPLVLFPTQQGRNIQSSWVVLLPWRRVKSVWQSIMHCPLSSGAAVRFGGIDEAHQVASESGTPWFPADYPGTEAGFEWELRERHKAEAEWLRKPKGRRVEYETLNLGGGRKGEIGRGWACDWEVLLAEDGMLLVRAMRLTWRRATSAVARIALSADPGLRHVGPCHRARGRQDHNDRPGRAS
jgi:ribonuclease P/MRP protein subunit POP1